MFFVVEVDRACLADLVRRVRDGRLTPRIGDVRPLAEAPEAYNRIGRRLPGKTIIRIAED